MIDLNKDELLFLLESAINSANVGIWEWNIKTGETVFNKCWAKIIGYTLEELQPISIQTWSKFCHPDDLAKSNEMLNKYFKGELEYYDVFLRMKHKNGQWIWVRDRGSIIKWDENKNPLIMCGIHTDITELKNYRDSLEHRIKLEKLINIISAKFIGMSINELDKVINDALQKIGNFCEVDRSYVFLIKDDNKSMDNTHEWHAPGISPQIQNLKNLPVSSFPWWMNKMQTFEHIYIKKVADLPPEAKSEKEILESQNISSLIAVPIHYNGKLFGFMGFDSVKIEKVWINTDIDLLETVGDIIANAIHSKIMQEKLILAKEKAEESEHLKSAFLATMNHELRTPLNHIMGFSDILSNYSDSEQVKSFASIIYHSSTSLLEILEDIFSLALADQTEIKIRKETFKVNDIFLHHMRVLEEILEVSGKKSSITLSYKVSSDILNNYYISDKNKIAQALLNLFKNAIKFTHEGSIEYGLNLKDNHLLFYVKDTGIGIPPEKQNIIFEYFRQADDTSTRSFGGIGIGLSISKKIATILGGSVQLESEVGKGSIFYFSVPVENAHILNIP